MDSWTNFGGIQTGAINLKTASTGMPVSMANTATVSTPDSQPGGGGGVMPYSPPNNNVMQTPVQDPNIPSTASNGPVKYAHNKNDKHGGNMKSHHGGQWNMQNNGGNGNGVSYPNNPALPATGNNIPTGGGGGGGYMSDYPDNQYQASTSSATDTSTATSTAPAVAPASNTKKWVIIAVVALVIVAVLWYVHKKGGFKKVFKK